MGPPCHIGAVIHGCCCYCPSQIEVAQPAVVPTCQDTKITEENMYVLLETGSPRCVAAIGKQLVPTNLLGLGIIFLQRAKASNYAPILSLG